MMFLLSPHKLSSYTAQDDEVGKAMMSQNLDQQVVVQDKVDTTLASDNVESKSKQEVTLTYSLDATSGGNDHEVVKVVTSEKREGSKPTTTSNNNKGSTLIKVSKSSFSDKEQNDCKSNDKNRSSRGRSWHCGSSS